MAEKLIQKLRILHGNIHEWNKRLKKQISERARIFRNRYERRKLKSTEFSIISNTCIGGVICHDMGLRFLSPTVNIYIRPVEFVRFCENLHYYLEQPFVEEPYNDDIGYPVAKLGDITLYCKHFTNFEDAKSAWERRCKRIEWDHIYLMMTDRDFIPPVSITKKIDACDETTIERFDALPFRNKACIVKDSKYTEKYKSCRQLTKGCDKNCVGIITNKIGITGKRMYQYVKDFDYIKFINNGF